MKDLKIYIVQSGWNYECNEDVHDVFLSEIDAKVQKSYLEASKIYDWVKVFEKVVVQ